MLEGVATHCGDIIIILTYGYMLSISIYIAFSIYIPAVALLTWCSVFFYLVWLAESVLYVVYAYTRFLILRVVPFILDH